MRTVGSLVSVIMVLAASVEPLRAQSLDAKDWVAAYCKLGGKASLYNGQADIVGVTKLRGQEPNVKLGEIAPAKGIRKVLLGRHGVLDEDLIALAHWDKLEEVDVFDGERVTDAGLKAVAAIPTLKSLVLMDTAVTGEGLAALSGHKQLAFLKIANPDTTGSVHAVSLTDMPRLGRLMLNCPGLEQLSVTKMPSLHEVERLPASMKSAEFADVGELTELEFRTSTLANLSIKGAPKLKLIDLRNTKVSKETLAEIRGKLPNTVVKW